MTKRKRDEAVLLENSDFKEFCTVAYIEWMERCKKRGGERRAIDDGADMCMHKDGFELGFKAGWEAAADFMRSQALRLMNRSLSEGREA